VAKQPAKSSKNPASQPVDAEPVGSSHHGSDGESTPAPPRNLTEAKLRVQTAVPYIRKRGKMTGGGSYNFVRDTDVIAMLRGPMIESGLALAGPKSVSNVVFDEIKTVNGKAMFRCRGEFTFELVFAATNEREPIVVLGVGSDFLDKDANKAMSAARKYALLLGFNLTTGDDPDQFDAEGQHNDHGDDENASQKGERQQSQKAEQKEQKNDQKADQKQQNGNAAHLPADGKELHARLTEYDKKLAGQKLCAVGDLLSHVTAAGVKAGFTANMTEWSGPAIQLAVDAVKEFETAKRNPKPAEAAPTATTQAPAGETPKAAEPAKEQPKPEAKPAEQPKEAAKEEPKPAETAKAAEPTAKAGPTPQEKFDKRIAGMNASSKLDNLNAFRAKYADDDDMTPKMKGELETCYWTNQKRITSASVRT